VTRLPSGWAQTRFDALFDFKGGSQPPKSTFSDVHLPGYVRLLQIRDFESDAKAVFIKDGPRWPKCSVKDIMIGRYGASVGKILTGKAGAYNVALVRTIFDRNLLNAAWVQLFLLSDHFQQPLKRISRSAQNGFNKTDLEEIEVPLPPLPEQRQIVAKIDSLSGKSKRARDHLGHIPRLVEKYKHAVLAAAFRGDLTREWRKGKGLTITGGIIAKMRQEAWQRAHESRQIRGKYGPSMGAEWLPELELPDGWAWASVDQIAFLVQYGTSAKTNESEDGIAVLRMGNIQDGKLELSSLKFLPVDHDEIPELMLENGDLLFNRTNSAELVGKSAVYKGEPRKASFASYLIRVRCSGLLPELLNGYVSSSIGREWVASVVNQQVGQANVNGTKLRQLGVPVMPIQEQKEIVRRIEHAFGWIDRLANEATSARKLVDNLDQAVLAKAFRGELVPQDPNDEPASVLLDRIKAERAAVSIAGTKRKAKAKAKA
jgi:type I restriction enzyme S subunit